MRWVRKIGLLLLVGFLSIEPVWAQVDTFFVTTHQDIVDPNDGVLSLREALSSIHSPHAVVRFLLPAEESDTVVLSQAGLPNSTASLYINGMNQGPSGGMITIDGNGFPAFTVDFYAEMRIDSMAIIRCRRPLDNNSRGGAIHNLGYLVLNDVHFADNHADMGGAICSGSDSPWDPTASLQVTRCEFADNSAYGATGGGAIGLRRSTLSLSGCLFLRDSASQGGALSMRDIPGDSTLIFDRCSFEGCVSQSQGGAIYEEGVSAQISNSTLVGNKAQAGGGLYHAGRGYLQLQNCAFRQCEAVTDGGAIALGYDGTESPLNSLYLVQNSFSQNRALSGDGGAIYTSETGCRLLIDNSFFVQNSAERGGAIASMDTLGVPYDFRSGILNTTFADNESSIQGDALFYNRFVGIANSIVAGSEDDSSRVQIYVPSPAYNGIYKMVARYDLISSFYHLVDTLAVDSHSTDSLFYTDETGANRLFSIPYEGVEHIIYRLRPECLSSLRGCGTATGWEGRQPLGAWRDSLSVLQPFDAYSVLTDWQTDSVDLLGRRRWEEHPIQGALVVQPLLLDTLRISACDSFYYERNQRFYTQSQTILDTLWGVMADSVRVVELTLYSSYAFDTTVYSDVPYLWHDSLYASSTDAVFRATTQYGCDSIERLHFHYRQAGVYDTAMTACESLYWRGRWRTSFQRDTVYYDTLHLADGYDSIYTLHLTLHSSSRRALYDTLCQGYPWEGVMYEADTILERTMTDQWGCDSIEQWNLCVLPSVIVWDTLWAVDSCVAGTEVYYGDTIVTDLGMSAAGCDSTHHYVVRMTYSPIWKDTIVQGCAPLAWHQQEYYQSCVVTDTIQGGIRDTIWTAQLVVGQSDTNYLSQQACDFYFWEESGETYEGDTLVVRQHRNVSGCDSLLVLQLTVYPSYSETFSQIVCDSFVWEPTGRCYYFSEQDTLRYTNAQGCDSLLVLDLTVNHSRNGFDRQEACDWYTWPLNGVTYSSSTDQPYAHINTREGCDSLVFLQLNIRYSSTLIIDDTICQGDTYYFDGNPFTASGTYGVHYQNAIGCDSNVTLFLSVLEPPHLQIIHAYSCVSGENYLTSNVAMPYMEWSSNPPDPGLSHQKHQQHITVTPSLQTQYSLVVDYSQTPMCPVRKEIVVNPVVRPQAKMSYKPQVLTIDDPYLYALDNSEGNANGRAWYINGEYFTSHPVLWYPCDPTMDTIRLMMVAFSATCNDTAWATIPYQAINLSVPNAFTPMQETNNQFLVQGVGIASYEIWVYSRTGILVYHSTDMEEGWDGTYQGTYCQPGSYVYKISYTLQTQPQNPLRKTGQVLLIN